MKLMKIRMMHFFFNFFLKVMQNNGIALGVMKNSELKALRLQHVKIKEPKTTNRFLLKGRPMLREFEPVL